MYEITYRFGYDELQSMSAEDASRIGNERISERLVSVCDDFRAAIKDSGMSLVDIGIRSNQSNSAILKSLTRSFSMIPERLDLFCDCLFPMKTLDEVFFGENLPMPIPNIDCCYLDAYAQLVDEEPELARKNEAYIKEIIQTKKPVAATPFSRYFGVREDRWTDDPIRREYRQFPPVVNITSYSMWRANEAHPQFKTLAKIAYYADMSLDFLVRQDYSVCNLYKVENGKKRAVGNTEKARLKKFCVLSYEDKAEIIEEMLKRIDYRFL